MLILETFNDLREIEHKLLFFFYDESVREFPKQRETLQQIDEAIKTVYSINRTLRQDNVTVGSLELAMQGLSNIRQFTEGYRERVVKYNMMSSTEEYIIVGHVLLRITEQVDSIMGTVRAIISTLQA